MLRIKGVKSIKTSAKHTELLRKRLGRVKPEPCHWAGTKHKMKSLKARSQRGKGCQNVWNCENSMLESAGGVSKMSKSNKGIGTYNYIQAFTGNCHIVLTWCNHFSGATEIICASCYFILNFGTEYICNKDGSHLFCSWYIKHLQ